MTYATSLSRNDRKPMTHLETAKQLQTLLSPYYAKQPPLIDGRMFAKTADAFTKLRDLAEAEYQSGKPTPTPAPQPIGDVDAIVDINHANDCDFDTAQAGGLLALIHKATQGTGFRDVKYPTRRVEAQARGILFGSYHFASGDSVSEQVRNYLSTAQPVSGELVSLDYEPNPNGSTMTISQAREFVQRVFDALGRWPVLYSGNLIRETWNHVDNDPLLNCRLWYACYRSEPLVFTGPWTFPPFLWQFTGDGQGPEPHTFPGFGVCDRNRFFGSADQLRAQWAT